MNKLSQNILVLLFIISSTFPCFTFASDSLVLYYTRTGTNKIIAEYIQSQIPNATIAEIKTPDDRNGLFGFVTCLFDQWFDRDAEIKKPSIDLTKYDNIVCCSPIWLQDISSPIRTYIKQSDLTGKTMHLFLTYGGRLQEDNKKEIEEWMVEHGIILKGTYGSAVGGKTEEEIKKQIDDHLREAKLLEEKKVSNL